LQKAFLRSPLKFAAPITSHFSQSRFHPILKTYRPHLGVDYGAPTGTPVQSIGNGHVIFAGMSGGSGNLVRIAHSNGYETMYMHLSRILVHVGEHVDAGERIGLVGMTGLATGPHLDFRILQNGAYRNFETLHLPPAEPVARKDMPEFVTARDHWMNFNPAKQLNHCTQRLLTIGFARRALGIIPRAPAARSHPEHKACLDRNARLMERQ
jgi:murein DD-endopeptidase MepM/ murein hydrolase activator NlpD